MSPRKLVLMVKLHQSACVQTIIGKNTKDRKELLKVIHSINRLKQNKKLAE